MFDSLAALPSYLQIVIWIIAAVLLTYLLMISIHRLLPLEIRHQHNNVVGFIVAVVAVFYALIVASVLVIAIGHFDGAQKVVEKEANLVADVLRNARTISPQIGAPATKLVKQYLDDVMTREWPLQEQGQKTTLGLQTLAALNQLVSQYEPQNQRESAYYAALIHKLNDLYDARRERIFRSDAGIANEIWVVTLAGGILTVGFVLLFGVQRREIHFLLSSILAISIALIFALISLFDRPFQGDLAVSDQPYRLIRQQVE